MVFVDGHVHIYDCFEIAGLFDAAHRNFREAARRHGAGSRFTGVLMLTETSADHWFQRLVAHASNEHSEVPLDTTPWRVHLLPDKGALLATLDTGERLYLIAGRQIITSEGLEVLALASDRLFDDGKPIVEVLAAIRAQGAIPVIPWAVGKWLGNRGKVLSDVLQVESGKDLFLGDNGGRPVFWRYVSHFRQARSSGVCILPGSDPLPFASEISRVGSFGFLLNGVLSNEQPVAGIKELLRNNDAGISSFGGLDTPMRFLFNQARLRMARRAV